MNRQRLRLAMQYTWGVMAVGCCIASVLLTLHDSTYALRFGIAGCGFCFLSLWDQPSE